MGFGKPIVREHILESTCVAIPAKLVPLAKGQKQGSLIRLT